VFKEALNYQGLFKCYVSLKLNIIYFALHVGFFDRGLEKNLTRIQCGVYDSNAIRSEDGYIMSPEKPVRIVPGKTY
jgi:hypothetical protein